MFLHITFSDGSNPYLMYGTIAEINKEVKKWKRNYTQVWRRDYTSGVFMEFKPRVAMPTDLFSVPDLEQNVI